ncbi:tRNA (adenosine(37)-N6)-threonylcarbamoyltransferase complex dimerization subunit type 1 TsaB [Virgibacillus siamensis]|uniref:tRNA (adenosine(37)-N6)-threonylcarbamoyltransferase complex dimerization subunit type 1 TsaB n=1 Tax=Virgibacillus siamensis TaxID=480071 RepID=UPI00098764EB|nr:tRNA (adenosine(37)-N6)-threonylcarbamoyltransferase complex dimerization subunit type 1 TsaB [Virgibacillus siamensis]
MNVLAIDTSNQILGIALLKDGQLLGEIVTNIKKNHSVRLMPAINQLMQEVNMKPDQLDKIVTAKGPGSYTGVRIGLTTAKSMAWALNIPVVGVSSLEVLAYQGRFSDTFICPFFDARRGLVYTGLYAWKNKKITPVQEEQNILMEDWLQQLPNADIMFLSQDIQLHEEKIIKHLGDRALIPDGASHLPNPVHLAFAGLDKQPEETHALVPNYIRLAEAEANWLKARKGKQEYD